MEQTEIQENIYAYMEKMKGKKKLKEKDSHRSRLVVGLVNRPERLLGTILITNNFNRITFLGKIKINISLFK